MRMLPCLLVVASIFADGCAHLKGREVIENEKLSTFEKSLADANVANIETGYIVNSLFGNDSKLSDENGVSNRNVKVFFFVRKANRPNAPYLVFLNGGPGFAITDMFLPNGYNSFLPEFNVVFFDQRGNGLSEKPTKDVHELRYFSARYIVDDAEKIREKILGKGSKWIVFGQSYGGVVARKYIEYASASIQKVITHGSAKYNAVDEAVAAETLTAKRAGVYFSKYPEDRKKIEKIKSELTDADDIKSETLAVRGKGIAHILAILFSIKSDEDFHGFLQKLDPSDLKQSYLAAIQPLAQLVLKGGLINQAVAQIDLIGGLVGEELTNEVKRTLKARGVDFQKAPFSKIFFEEAVTPISEDFKTLEALFAKKKFKPDVVNLDEIISVTTSKNLRFDVFGGEEDTLALHAIKNEESYVGGKNAKNIHYHYSKGHHREWLTNSEMFKDYL